jgi:hypothetical protein
MKHAAATAQVALTAYEWHIERPLEPARDTVAGAHAWDLANGCFEARRLREDGATYVGIAARSPTRWRRDSSGMIRLHLYRSPDAGYEIAVVIRGGVVEGTGHYWGFASGDRGPDEIVVGRRLGTDVRAVCT